MKLLSNISLIAIPLLLFATGAHAETIASARYATPVDRYGHYALGTPHEYAHLTATTHTGRKVTFQLPEDEVFEDIVPRLVKLAESEPAEILTIVSQRNSGARLVLFGLRDDRLVMSAQSTAIGIPNRWLNPVGVSDLDGDGQAEIAAVITPHIGGTLKIYRKNGAELDEVAALYGFSNHAYASPEYALSTPVTLAGKPYLAVPDTARLQLKIMALVGNRLMEARRCTLNSPITGAITLSSPEAISVATATGRQSIALLNCPNSAIP